VDYTGLLALPGLSDIHEQYVIRLKLGRVSSTVRF